MFSLRKHVKALLAAILSLLFLLRAWTVLSDLGRGDERALLAFPLAVIFPALLFIALMAQPKTETREGLLMRFGMMLHLLLIIAIPPYALHLALGFPFVFLTVELFETRLPEHIRNPVVELIVE